MAPGTFESLWTAPENICMQVVRMLDSLAHSLIPPSLLGSQDKDLVRTSRLFVYATLVNEAIGIMFVIYMLIKDPALVETTSFLGALGGVMSFYFLIALLRITQNPTLCAWLFLLCSHVVVFWLCASDTGVQSEYFLWYVTFIMFAFYVIGVRAGCISLLLVLLEAVILLIGHPFVSTAAPPMVANPFPVLFRRLGIVLIVGIITCCYEHSRVSIERERDIAIENLRQASKAKERFLANMSHELRTPMHGIIATAKELLSTPGIEETTRQDLRIINDCAEHMLSLVCDILDFERIESDKFELEKSVFDIFTQFSKVHKMVAITARAKRIELPPPEIDIKSEHRLRIGDPLRFRQIIANLLSNAIKFTPEGGHVNVIARNGNEDCRDLITVEVVDTGIGISEEGMQHLFESFSQVDGGVARRYGGLGLGLAICKKLCIAMGGDIRVESRQGVGSIFRFWVRLPVFAEDAAAVVVLSESDEGESEGDDQSDWVRGCRVLLAEDNQLNQKVAVRMLSAYGMRAVVVSNGDEAVREIVQRRSEYDIVLMDCQMPVMDGFEATRRIREWERQTGVVPIPVIALTASATAEYQQSCMDAGMSEFLTKPLRKEVLHKILRKWCRSIKKQELLVNTVGKHAPRTRKLQVEKGTLSVVREDPAKR